MNNIQNKTKIPCSVCILTFNSEKGLRRCLESVTAFDELIICDGGSTDGTLEIALKYGALVIPQSQEFLDKNNRLVNFSGVRNQMLKTAKYDWQFHLDSDETLTKELAAEIDNVILEENKRISENIFLVPRKYLYLQQVIDTSITYPNSQYRFFNRMHVTNFSRTIHERINFSQDEKIGTLANSILVPIEMTPEEQWEKFKKYIAMEVKARKNINFETKVYFLKLFLKRFIALLYRFLAKTVFGRGRKLPIEYEINTIKYQVSLFLKLMF